LAEQRLAVSCTCSPFLKTTYRVFNVAKSTRPIEVSTAAAQTFIFFVRGGDVYLVRFISPNSQILSQACLQSTKGICTLCFIAGRK